MTLIREIILDVLENNHGKCLDNDTERAIVAQECEAKLLKASLNQLADLIGGSVEFDNFGQAVIYTNIGVEVHDE